MNLDRTNNYTRQYAEACKEVAAEMGLPVVDLWSSMQAGEVGGGCISDPSWASLSPWGHAITLRGQNIVECCITPG